MPPKKDRIEISANAKEAEALQKLVEATENLSVIEEAEGATIFELLKTAPRAFPRAVMVNLRGDRVTILTKK